MSLVQRAAAAATQRVRFRTARSRRTAPTASFTFDDFPRSAWTTGGPILARYEALATYFTAGRYCDSHENGLEYYSPDDLRAVAAAGHEIGCHTFSHQSSPAVGSRELMADMDRNQAFVGSVLGPYPLETFAYPYGDASPRTKALVSRRYAVGRGIRPGVNGRTVDMGQLRAVPLEIRNWTAELVERNVEAARGTNGWVVFFSHDVSEAPSPYGATPAMLEHALATVRNAGLDILTVRDACDQLH